MNNIDILVEIFKRMSKEEIYEFVSIMNATAPKILEAITFDTVVVELEKKYSTNN